jgi:N-acetylglutamate synthase-like GNAT family acetyltransferase
MTKYGLDSFVRIRHEIEPLLKQHWDEIALNKESIKLNPHWRKYSILDRNNMLRVYTARKDDELIGYFVVILESSLHYMDHTFAHNDVIFLAKQFRKGLTGVKLIKYAMDSLAEEGVKQLFINTKLHQPFDLILERLEFNEVEKVYAKVLR